MRYTITIALSFALLFSTQLCAQTPANQTLAVYPVQAAKKFAPAQRVALRSTQNAITVKIEEVLSVLQLFDLVDRTRVDALMREMQFQDVMSEEAVAQLGKAAGAEVILFPVLDHYEDYGLNASITMSFKLIEVATTKVLFVRSISRTAPATRFNRKEVAAQLVGEVIREMAEGLFVQSGKHKQPYPVVTFGKDSKGIPETAVVFVKNPFFVREGTRFSLVQVKKITYEGQEETSTIAVGELSVTALRGDNLDCEVLGKKKEREAIADMLGQGETLFAVFQPGGN